MRACLKWAASAETYKLWLGGGRHLGEDVHHGLIGEVLQVLLVLA